MTPLYGHISEETAYLVDDYPYSFTLRCRIRYWVEYKPSKGFRFVSQTENPKSNPPRWNKPKASTYAEHAACMYLDDKGHVQCSRIGIYDEADKVVQFIKDFPNADLVSLRAWVLMKVAMYRKLVSGVAYITINGAKQERSEDEQNRDKASLARWEEAMVLLRPAKEAIVSEVSTSGKS